MGDQVDKLFYEEANKYARTVHVSHSPPSHLCRKEKPQDAMSLAELTIQRVGIICSWRFV